MDIYKILIVDDQLIGRQLLESILFREDYELFFAEDGQQALDQIYEHQPDVVLLDVMMPHIDGFEVCRRVRGDEKIKDTPIILVTALDDRDSRLNGFESGANDYVSKPIDRLELLARVKNLTQLFRYKKQSAGISGNQEVTKILETPQDFLEQINQYIMQDEDENIKSFFPDYIELKSQTEVQTHSGSFVYEKNGLINLLYFHCGQEQFCNEAAIILNSLFPKMINIKSEIGLRSTFDEIIIRLDKYFQDRFQQSISEKASFALVEIDRIHHKYRTITLNIEIRILSINTEGHEIKSISDNGYFNASDKMLLFASKYENYVESINSNSFSDIEALKHTLRNIEQEIMIAGFTLG